MIVAHEGIAQAYTSLIRHIFGLLPDNIMVVEIGSHESADGVSNKFEQALARFDVKSDILILTDIFGATPCNVAQKFVCHNRILLTGLNAPMMIKAIQNAPLRNDVNVLADEVKASAITGVMLVSHQNTGNPI
ncbi:PTS mannose transporter subunit IIA [Neisseriaceae bacterium ESL0693]|nr:PTS mannose transporter subunit IIA [Neisseriaceae bacterium ESL0693]